MNLSERYRLTIEYFQKIIPTPETELKYHDAFELLVAVILSAQCTDKRVNIITPALLGRYPDALSMSKAEPGAIFGFIKSCTFPNNKAKHLAGMAKMLVNEFDGRVPSETSLLMRLPGVGRKSANVISSVIFNKPVMAVDTHVFRVAHRIGLVTNAPTPLSVEKQLTAHIPSGLIHMTHHWLILHGRYICKARNPLCNRCGLTGFCIYYSKMAGRKSKAE